MKNLIQYSLVFCLVISSVSAVADNEEVSVSVDFRIFLWPYQFCPYYTGPARIHQSYGDDLSSNIGEAKMDDESTYVHYLRNADSFAPLKLQEGVLSDWYTYAGRPRLDFYGGHNPETENAVHQTVASVDIDVESKKLLIILFPLDEKSFKIASISYPFDELSEGEAAVMNVSSSLVMCSLGGDVFELKSGGFSVQSAISEDERLEIIVVADRTENRWRRKIARKYPRFRENSSLFIIYPRTLDGEGLDVLRIGL